MEKQNEIYYVGIDRDNTLNKDPAPGYFGQFDDWREKLELWNGAIDGIKLLNQYPQIKVAVITNQAGAANGLFGHDPDGSIKEVNRTIDSILRKGGATIHNWQYCPWVSQDYIRKKLEKKPDLKPNYAYVLEDNDPRLELRKPGIGMLKQSAKEMGFSLSDFAKIYFIGDRPIDVDIALNANGKGIFIYNKGLNDKYKEEIEARPEYGTDIIIVNNLLEAAEFITNDISSMKTN